ncbi:MAG: HU family DNA-binding protein [Duodenibacillus sp.]|nr:HU family DNA-binding protein [Duodenibacillus sp.]
MTKNQLIELIAMHADISKSKASLALDSFVTGVQMTLQKGESLTLPGFGTFCVVERAARTGRNPATGEPVEIPASRTPKFKPSKILKDVVK